MGSSPSRTKKEEGIAFLFFWCGQQDSNLHALAVEPKSTESTNSTMPAYFLVPVYSITARLLLSTKAISQKSQKHVTSFP